MHGDTGKQITIEYFIRALPQNTAALPARAHTDAIVFASVNADWGDLIMNPPWNGNWAKAVSFEDRTDDAEDMRQFEFRDDAGRIADEDQYRRMCADIAAFWKLHLLERYPGLPEKKLDAALKDAKFHYSPEYAAIAASFPHTGLSEYKTPRKPGLFEKLLNRKKGCFDKTVCLYILPFVNLNHHRNLFDEKVRQEIVNAVWEDAVRTHYRQELRPPVNSNISYMFCPSPVMNDEMKAVAQFWDEDTRQIIHRDRYKNLCDQMRPLMREWLTESFPKYDREKIEDGLERIRFDYSPEQGTITACILLEKLMPIKADK